MHVRMHDYTSCNDHEINNRGYCKRCDELTFQQRDRYLAALTKISLATVNAQNKGACALQSIADEALKG